MLNWTSSGGNSGIKGVAVTPDILKATQFSSDEALQVTLQLLRTRSSRYAWYGTFIASLAVLLACMMVAQHFYDGISYETLLRAQRENVAIWVLDGMPFLFAIWGQAVSFRTTRDAGSAIKIRTSSLRRTLRKERINARLRTDYFAKLSHEFRTPLNSILGMTDMLLEKAESKPLEQDIKVIHGAAENLLALINDVLDYSAMEAGRVELDRVEFDLCECISNACAMLRPQARTKGLDLNLVIEPGVPHFVMGDPGRLRQIVVNLVGNAIKFTSSGRVECHIGHAHSDEKAPHRITLTVADTGRGMDDRTLKRLFRPYGRGDARDVQRVEGTGLGLAICHEIVDAMGGDISVVSEPDKGTTFTVHVLFEPQQGISLARLARNIELRGVRLLLAESPSEERARLEVQLRALGLDVRVVDDGIEAFKEALLGYVQGRPYELLVTDLFAEHLCGEQLARLLKARAETADICLVATTASGSRGDGKRVRDAGFSGYLTKPIPPEHLGDLLRATLATLAVAADRREPLNLITRHYIRENAAREVVVLLIEDERISLEVTRARLENLGCEVTCATTAAEALDALRKREFNLVLVDYNLPDRRGDETVKCIMEQSSEGAPPIIMFSAGLTQAEKQRCLRAGALGFLEKPAMREGLLSILERYCRLPIEEESKHGIEGAEATPALRKIFVRESLTRMTELEKAIGAELNREAIYRNAHAMRSSSRHLGATALASIFEELEADAMSGSQKNLRAKVGEVLRCWREIVEMFERVPDKDKTVRMQ